MSQEIVAIMQEVKRVRESKANLDTEEKLLWDRFFEIADDISGPNENYRFVSPELDLSIGREMHQASPKLKVEELKKALTEEQWMAVTKVERVLDQGKLEEAIARDEIPGTLVDQFVENYEPVAHRKFGKVTKKDLEEISA